MNTVIETFCPGCNSTGILWARKKNEPVPLMPFIFRCMCSFGDMQVRNYPKWHRGLKEQYETIRGDEKVGVAK